MSCYKWYHIWFRLIFTLNATRIENVAECHSLTVVHFQPCHDLNFVSIITKQGGITWGVIEEASRSSKAIDERIVINFRTKNTVFALFCDNNSAFDFVHKVSWYVMIYYDMSWFIMPCHDMYDKNVAILFYQLPIFSIDSNSVLSIATMSYR